MLGVLTLCAVFLLSFIVFLIVFGPAFVGSPIKQRVTRISRREKAEEPSGPKRPYSFLIEVIKRLGPIGTPKKEMEISRAQMRLMRAGYRGKNVRVIFYGLKVFLAASFGATLLLVRAYWGPFAHTQTWVLAVLLIVFGFYFPDLWIYLRAKDRKKKIIEGFPDALDLLVVCMEAGQSLDAAINRVGQEIGATNKVLSDEIKSLNLEIRAGKPRREALKSLALRTNSDEISSFTVLINQTEEFGVSVAQALRVHADSMRTRRTQKAEELAAKIPVKLAIPLVLFIMPSIFVVVIAPAVIRAITAWKGGF